MPVVASKGDALVNVVEMTNDRHQGNLVNILAGCEDGSIVLAEMLIPDQDDNLYEELNNSHR